MLNSYGLMNEEWNRKLSYGNCNFGERACVGDQVPFTISSFQRLMICNYPICDELSKVHVRCLGGSVG